MYLTRIALVGFLSSDAEKKVSKTTNIAVFSLGRPGRMTPERGESRTEWLRCVAFGKLADFAGNLVKGAHVAVAGELRSQVGGCAQGSKGTEGDWFTALLTI
jgi:single-strand DNA-binding protein